ncbi:MAG TPA: SPW repeat protein [Solirubrobacteraceae bacterium]|jgi:FtsH-binding integral membrane protein|nr:SPW repeat protein [Solirubrobacteraceae bacterium]
MLRQGPIPRAVHGILDYGYAALLIAAPFLLGFSDEGAATAVSIVAGIVVLIAAASTKCFPTSVIKSLPVAGHLTLDFALVAALIVSPFLFGFSDDSTPTAFFIVAAVIALLVTLATRWSPDRDAARTA